MKSRLDPIASDNTIGRKYTGQCAKNTYIDDMLAAVKQTKHCVVVVQVGRNSERAAHYGPVNFFGHIAVLPKIRRGSRTHRVTMGPRRAVTAFGFCEHVCQQRRGKGVGTPQSCDSKRTIRQSPRPTLPHGYNGLLNDGLANGGRRHLSRRPIYVVRDTIAHVSLPVQYRQPWLYSVSAPVLSLSWRHPML